MYTYSYENERRSRGIALALASLSPARAMPRQPLDTKTWSRVPDSTSRACQCLACDVIVETWHGRKKHVASEAHRRNEIIRAEKERAAGPAAIPTTPGGFNVVLADPPWEYSNKASVGAARAEYPTMSLARLRSLPVSSVAAVDSVLFLWTTGPMLIVAGALVKAWGFEYKNVFVAWEKLTKKGKKVYGPGNHSRGGAEYLFVATRGRYSYSRLRGSEGDRSIDAVWRGHCGAPPGTKSHSRKPDEQYEWIQRYLKDDMKDVPKLELFARRRREGWSSWGEGLEK